MARRECVEKDAERMAAQDAYAARESRSKQQRHAYAPKGPREQPERARAQPEERDGNRLQVRDCVRAAQLAAGPAARHSGSRAGATVRRVQPAAARHASRQPAAGGQPGSRGWITAHGRSCGPVSQSDVDVRSHWSHWLPSPGVGTGTTPAREEVCAVARILYAVCRDCVQIHNTRV